MNEDRRFNARLRTLYAGVSLAMGFFALGAALAHFADLHKPGILFIFSGTAICFSANRLYFKAIKHLHENDLPPGYSRSILDYTGFLAALLGAVLAGYLTL